jgi:cytochrome b561
MMDSLVSFCREARKPADLFGYLLLTLTVFASGRLKSLLHEHHWMVLALILTVLFIHIIDSLSRKRLSKDPIHVR